jgi:hypothetical protein
MSPHDLKAEIARWFDKAMAARMAVSVQSFSYKRGIPRGVDMVFDCRFPANPHWVAELRPLDGRDPAVAAYVQPIPALCRVLTIGCKSFAVPASRPSGRGQGASVHRLWLYRRATPVGCSGRKTRANCLPKRAGRCQNGTGNWNAGPAQCSHRPQRPVNEGGERLIGIVIVAHGGLAREYLSAVEHVVGRQDGVRRDLDRG